MKIVANLVNLKPIVCSAAAAEHTKKKGSLVFRGDWEREDVKQFSEFLRVRGIPDIGLQSGQKIP